MAQKPHFGTAFGSARGGDPSAKAELVRLTGSDLYPPIVRATALALLARTAGEDGIAALGSALDAEEPLLRHTAAMYLPLVAPEDVERFAPLLSDPVKAVRMAAVSRLAPVPRDRLRPYQQAAFDEALDEYREAMLHGSDFASARFNLGNLEAALGNDGAAERHYRDALVIDDLFVPAKSNLAILLSGQGRNDGAEALLREILRDYPDDAGTMYSLGLLLVEIGRPDEAVDWLRRSATLRPDDARTRYNLGLLLQQVGRASEAEQALRRALEIEPEGLDYLYAYADHLFRRGRLDEALALAERMIALHPDQPIGHQMKSVIVEQR